jgi:hypothetical protein
MHNNSKNRVSKPYIYFCTHFLKCVVGQRFEEKMEKNVRLSSIVTPSDEALALILTENNEARWLTQFEGNDRCNQDPRRLLPSKYTSTGHAKKGRGFTKKSYGWTLSGIQHFNSLVFRIRKDREENGEFFDQKFAEHWNNLYSSQRKQRDGINVPDMVEAEMDLLMEDSAGEENESNPQHSGGSENHGETEVDDENVVE